ncbi:MAG: pyridoxine 5'-phosphate synthase [Opitutae bacterium]|nr:pyridoxine 5'-phosphate synthase [Opitutae bacterium]MCD8298214.1 pyridoxine 5'-phosphate synthase [Opitutae bacterium]
MKKAILLGVNIDHSATLRQARYRGYESSCGKMVEPDPVAIALAAEQAGADGITVHLREDRRHIQERDVLRLRESLHTRMNLEMAPTPEMVKFALTLKPDSVCLVPERREEISTEGGLDAAAKIAALTPIVAAFSQQGIAASLFIDPDQKQIDAAATIGAPFVELHTGAYANAYYDNEARAREFRRLCKAAEAAANVAIKTNAGHGINYVNISEVVEIPHLHELNIGHSILCRALMFGIDEAVREMKARMREGFSLAPRP